MKLGLRGVIKCRLFVNSHSAKAIIAFAFLFFLFGLNISHASAATYYVSNDLGDDTRTAIQAQSSATPWKNHPESNLAASNSLAKQSNFSAGDKIIMRKGEIWWNTQLYAKQAGSGSADNQLITTTTEDGFGTGANPIINAAVLLNGAWTDTGVNGEFKISLASSPGVVYNGDTALTSGTPGSLASNGFGWSTNFLYVKIGSDPTGGNIQSSTGSFPVRVPFSYRAYRNLDLRYADGTTNGVFYNAAIAVTGVVLSNSTVSRGLTYQIRCYNCTSPTINNNTVTGIPSNAGNGVLIYMSNGGSGGSIYGNTLNGGHFGIQPSSSMDIYSNTLSNLYLGMNITGDSNSIHNNDFSNWNGVEYPSGWGNDLQTGFSASGNIIRNNYFHGGLYAVGLYETSGAGNNQLVYNIIKDAHVNEILVGTGGTTVNPDLVANNILIHNPTAGSGGIGHGVVLTALATHGKEFTQGIIKNNLFVGETSGAEMFSVDTGLLLYLNGQMNKINMDYNYYWQKNTGSAWRRFNNSGLDTTDFAVWKSDLNTDGVTGAEANSINVLSTGKSPFVDIDNVNLLPASDATSIDAGTSVGLTTDYSGNPIYGAPDIGAYEYQPPYNMGTDKVDIASNVRVYGDGKFRTTETVGGTTADLSVIPQSSQTTKWLDIAKADDESAIIWEANHKKWKESSATLGMTNTLHTIGDLEANKYYNVSIDSTLALATITGADCTDGVCKSNNDGKITFTYTGGYSTHTFDIAGGDNTAPTVINGTSSKFHTDITSVILTLTTDENSTCHYSTNQGDVYAAMTAFTTTGETSHSNTVSGLTPGDYTYYAICRDGVGNDISYTLTFEIAQRENNTGTSDAKLKIDGNNEALDEDKKIYFDENEGRLKGQDNTIANGTVKIYKEGKKYATVDVDSNGSWNKKLSFGHDKTYTLKLKFYDQYGTLRDEKEYDVKVDTEKPIFTDPFPQTLTIQKDDKINFEATDDTGVDYYKIQILDNQGHIVRAWKKQTKSFYLIPENVLDQADTIVVRAYDKAGNYAEEEASLNIGENQSNIADTNTPADNSGNEQSNQEANSTSTPNVCSYTVASGDTLWSIAKKVYGDATAYPAIIENNKDKYQDIESKLSIGQALTFGCKDNQAQQNTENNSNTDNSNQQLQSQPQPQDQSKTFQWWNPFTW